MNPESDSVAEGGNKLEFYLLIQFFFVAALEFIQRFFSLGYLHT